VIFTTDFLISLSDFMSKPPVAGFMIKQAVLAYIRMNGLSIGSGVAKCMTVRPLDDDEPKFDTTVTDMPVLYHPEALNFKAKDGIIILIKPEENNAKGKRQKSAKGKRRM